MIYKELLIELHRFLFWFRPKHKSSVLSFAEIMVLTVLYKEQCSTKQDILPSKLSEELGLSRSALSPILNELEKKGCIERLFNENDRRQIIIRLKSNPDDFMKDRKEMIQNVTQSLSVEERDQFLYLLKKINGSLKHMSEELEKGSL
jgi:MarR family transcriptional regulator, negative regulator of the multidrug operon emrRAB